MMRTGRPPEHGMSYTPEHRAYRHMLERCYSEGSQSYPWYGARGIIVCPEWRNDFLQFYSDMGDCPEGYTLDREDVLGNYDPDNCRWADRETQANNTSRNVIIEWDGQRLSIAQWARELDIGYPALYKRIAIKGDAFPRAARPAYAR